MVSLRDGGGVSISGVITVDAGEMMSSLPMVMVIK